MGIHPTKNDPGAYLDAVLANSTDKSGTDTLNTVPDSSFSAAGGGGTGRVVTAEHLPALGKPQSDAQGVSVLAWSLVGQPLVGMVDAQSDTQASDMTQLWARYFEPR